MQLGFEPSLSMCCVPGSSLVVNQGPEVKDLLDKFDHIFQLIRDLCVQSQVFIVIVPLLFVLHLDNALLVHQEIFENAHKLRAGHFLQIDLVSREIEERQYWNLEDAFVQPKYELSENEIVRQNYLKFEISKKNRRLKSFPEKKHKIRYFSCHSHQDLSILYHFAKFRQKFIEILAS